MRSRLITTSTIAVAGALAGCSGSETDASSEVVISSTTSPPTSARPTPPSSVSATATSASSSAPVPTETSPVSGAGRTGRAATATPVTGSDRPGQVVTRTQLLSMAKRIGCGSPTYKKGKSREARDVGVMGSVDCTAGGKGHVFVLMKPKTSPWAAALVIKYHAKASSVPYLRGDNWGLFAVTDPDGNGTDFDEPALKEAQRKIGAGDLVTA